MCVAQDLMNQYSTDAFKPLFTELNSIKLQSKCHGEPCFSGIKET